MESIWEKEVRRPFFPVLEGDRETEVLIIGGGLAGLLCAYWLGRAGVDCLLVEQGRVCGGVTANTTAKITWQHGLVYQKLIKEFGEEKAGLYLRANREALERYRELAKTIGCGFEERDNYVYSLADRKKLEQEAAALDRLGAEAELVGATELPLSMAGAVKVPGQAQFQPLKFALALAEGLPILEGTKVTELSPHMARTGRGTIRAEKIIVATHFPILNKHGGYFLKMYQHRSYVLALKNAAEVEGMYVDQEDTGLSFRPYGGLLLLGGGGHRTGKQGGNWQELRSFARRRYPGAAEAGRWAAQDCMTLDGVPYVGRYSPRTEGLYVATGFNKWGMTGSMAAALLLTDLVRGRHSPYEEVFSPQRTMLRPQLVKNAVHSAAGLLTPTTPRCPHMGCALKYNRAEHSWDCPCHGSRFGEDGTLLDGPATDGKKKL